jgi:hypothetical protein
MFETLMKPGSYRIDYFNEQAVGTETALGFYVCGELETQAAFSLSGRRSLLGGLSVIQQELGPQKLVAIYLDVSSPDCNARLAYHQMKRDLHAGMFRRVFVFRSCMLVRGKEMLADICQLSDEIGGFELITYDGGACRRHSLDELYAALAGKKLVNKDEEELAEEEV